MKKYTVHIIWVIVAIVALGGGYFWGKAAARPSFGSGSLTGTFGSSTRRTATGTAALGGLETGQVASIDSSSITLQLPTGSSEVVFYSSSTAVTKPTTVPVSDIAVGSTVMVGGTQNSDGSFTATSIQVRPAGSAGAGNGYSGRSGSASGSSQSGQ